MDIYREIIIEEANNPQNYGKLEGADIAAYHLNPSCGDEITVYLKLDEDDHIIDISWEGQGCIISRATMSVFSEYIKGRSLSELATIQAVDLLKLLELEEIVPGREKCLLVGLTAIHNIERK
jgi:nitrogen fixation protein NifU and related proteins